MKIVFFKKPEKKPQAVKYRYVSNFKDVFTATIFVELTIY